MFFIQSVLAMVYYGMAYQFKSHSQRLMNSLHKTPLLLFAQLPEGILNVLQKLFESQLSESPKLAFMILYPFFCFSAGFCSATTYLILRNPKTTSLASVLKQLRICAPKLFTSSLVLGLVLAPAILALIVPGVYVLSLYLFIPFVLVEDPHKTLSEIFGASKALSKTCKTICLLTAFLSFFLGLVSYLAPSLLTNLTEASSLGPFIEVTTGILVSFLLNIWTVSLFLEVKPS